MNHSGVMKRDIPKNRRLYPRLVDCDYLHLSLLRESIRPFALNCRGTVLDYGCGNKPYREFFSNTTCYIGADFEVQDKNDILLLPDGALPCVEQNFDAVVSFQVLEHVPSPDFFLEECWRALRPGGTLFFTTHGIWPYHPGPNNDDFLRWTAAGLYRLVTAHGFSDVSVSDSCGGYLSLLQQLLVIHDPARMARTPVKRFVCAAYYWLCNLFGAVALRAAPGAVQQGDILPICYVVTARKPEDQPAAQGDWIRHLHL